MTWQSPIASNQGHSFDSIRTFCEWIWDGAIGNVHTIHLGCAAVNSAVDRLPSLKAEHAVPPTLDWDLWLGPALDRPYHPAYLPGAWRRWVPFGNGAGGVRIIPEEKMKAYQQPPKTLPRGLDHYRDWLDAIRAGTKSGSDFTAYGGPLTELAMLGVIAIKFPGMKLEWDVASTQFTNCPEANQHISPPYREGWTL